MSNEWWIEETAYNPEKELLMETLFALSNGYMSCRGTLEEAENYPDIKKYPGTYAAGIFDKYSKDYQAIVNLPSLFNTPISLQGKPLKALDSCTQNYLRYLDMYNGTLVRKFTWTGRNNEKIEFEFTRFISKADPHLAVLRININPVSFSGKLIIDSVLDGNISNIDFHISGYQLRDEKYFFIDNEHEKSKWENGGCLTLKTKTTRQKITQGFKVQIAENGKKIPFRSHYQFKDRYLNLSTFLRLKKGNRYSFTKMISIYTSNDQVRDLPKAVEETLDRAQQKGYEDLLKNHCDEWNRIWEFSDIKITGNETDQRNIRFNIFHFIQMGNKNNPYVNIGSRGLTSEMHYGNCFWDTELFILPFSFIRIPETAKALNQI